MVRRPALPPLALGLIASAFFSLTFVLNRSMDLGGGFWVWTGVLRFAFMVPLLAVLVPAHGGWKPLADEVRRAPGAWVVAATVGFGLFYAPVCWAASFGQGWLVAGLWQLTIVAGTLLFPSKEGGLGRTLAYSALILGGVGLLLAGRAHDLAAGADWTVLAAPALLVAVGAAAYPWGNRRAMTLAGGRLTTVQRVTLMTLLSLPFWALLGGVSLAAGLGPTPAQAAQSFLVALFSGVVATLLFFRATDRVRHDPARLGAVEATQAGEVVFSLGGEMAILGAPWPGPWSALGLGLVVAGMVLHALPRKKPLVARPFVD